MTQFELFDTDGGDDVGVRTEPGTSTNPESQIADAVDRRPAIVVYTDGACSGNPGPGGWGWAVAPNGRPHGSGGEPETTNQRMELQAVLEALRSLGSDSESGPIEVVSDSTYVVNCFRDGWWVKWRRNGWKNAKKEPVANVDIWKPLVEIVTTGSVTFRWVKGHSGDPMNDLVDELAVAAVPRSGGDGVAGSGGQGTHATKGDVTDV